MISDASVAYFEEECALAVDPLSFDVRDASGIVPACQGMCDMSTRGCGGVSSFLNALGVDVF